jgi:hypothetical protein
MKMVNGLQAITIKLKADQLVALSVSAPILQNQLQGLELMREIETIAHDEFIRMRDKQEPRTIESDLAEDR